MLKGALAPDFGRTGEDSQPNGHPRMFARTPCTNGQLRTLCVHINRSTDTFVTMGGEFQRLGKTTQEEGREALLRFTRPDQVLLARR